MCEELGGWCGTGKFGSGGSGDNRMSRRRASELGELWETEERGRKRWLRVEEEMTTQ